MFANAQVKLRHSILYETPRFERIIAISDRLSCHSTTQKFGISLTEKSCYASGNIKLSHVRRSRFDRCHMLRTLWRPACNGGVPIVFRNKLSRVEILFSLWGKIGAEGT